MVDKTENRWKIHDGNTSRGRITTQRMARTCSKLETYRIQPSFDAVENVGDEGRHCATKSRIWGWNRPCPSPCKKLFAACADWIIWLQPLPGAIPHNTRVVPNVIQQSGKPLRMKHKAACCIWIDWFFIRKELGDAAESCRYEHRQGI